MPKSKRVKQISLTRTEKNVKERKTKLIDELHKCVDEYAYIYVFSVDNMRNNKLKDLRMEWRHSRFFFGKNRVMGVALGKSEDDEYRDGLSKITENITGQCGLLFTNQDKESVVSYFEEFSEHDFARSGNIATETVTLEPGPLEFPHSMEPHLRQLGMPVQLKKGVVTLLTTFTVCKEGAALTPEQTRILKLHGIQQSEFKVMLSCVWGKGGTFEILNK